MQTAGTLAAGLQGPASSGCSQGQQAAAGEPAEAVDGTQQGPQRKTARRQGGTDGAAMSSQQAGTAISEPQAKRQEGGRLARLGWIASLGGLSPERAQPADGQPAGLAPSRAELSDAAKAVRAAANCQEVHSEAGQAEEAAAEGCAPSGSSPAAASEVQSPAATKVSPEQPLPGKQHHSSGSERHLRDLEAQKQVGAMFQVWIDVKRKGLLLG